MFFSLIFATDIKSGGFSNSSKLPWNVKNDLQFFKEITSKEYKKNCKNVLIMGNNTFISKPALENRIELVLSSKNKGDNHFNSFESCLQYCEENKDKIGKVFVIGGKKLLEDVCEDSRCEELILTLLDFEKEIEYDNFIDYKKIVSNFKNTYTDVMSSECKKNTCNVSIMNKTYIKYETSEQSYLKLLRNVLDNGEIRKDRTGTGTISIFGPQIEINIEDSFPLLTTKKLNFNHILAEVLWFLSGDTDISFLKQNGVSVWNGNTTRDFLDKRGLVDYKEGDVGPLYGYQWRNFGGDFRNPESKGVDQIQRMLDILKTDPLSRRIFLSAWNPADLDKMALEPCHVSFQLYVSDNKYLDAKLYLRSNDLFLGAPWNIACYSLLLYMFGHLTGYKPRKLIYTIGDSHIYLDHISQVYNQLSRSTRPFPKLVINKKCENFEDFDMNSFTLENYNPHPFIKANMAI
jgi:thymidylate synthase